MENSHAAGGVNPAEEFEALARVAADPRTIMSQAEFAGQLGCARQNVNAAIRSGRLHGEALVTGDDGVPCIRLGPALAQWNKRKDMRGGPRGENDLLNFGGLEPEGDENPEAEEPGADSNGATDPAIRDAVAEAARRSAEAGAELREIQTEAARERVLALKRERELHEGRYRDVIEIARAMQTCGRKIRNQIIGIEVYADELASTFGVGPVEAREFLQRISRDLQLRLEHAMTELAEPQEDEEPEPDA